MNQKVVEQDVGHLEWAHASITPAMIRIFPVRDSRDPTKSVYLTEEQTRFFNALMNELAKANFVSVGSTWSTVRQAALRTFYNYYQGASSNTGRRRTQR